MSADASTAVVNQNFNFATYQAASPAAREDLLAGLYAQFDASDVDNTVYDEALGAAGDFIRDTVASSNLPDAIKERAAEFVEDAVGGAQRSSGGGIDADAEIMKMVSSMIMDMIKELGAEGEEQVEGGGKGKQKGGMNWLALLAQAMGEAAGKHMANAIELADKISTMGDKTGEDLQEHVGGDFTATVTEGAEGDEDAPNRADQARAMTVLQAQMQAETQMFKMVFEATSTLLKTIGEGFGTMARKQ